MRQSYYVQLASELHAMVKDERCPAEWKDSIMEAIRVLKSLDQKEQK